MAASSSSSFEVTISPANFVAASETFERHAREQLLRLRRPRLDRLGQDRDVLARPLDRELERVRRHRDRREQRRAPAAAPSSFSRMSVDSSDRDELLALADRLRVHRLVAQRHVDVLSSSRARSGAAWSSRASRTSRSAAGWKLAHGLGGRRSMRRDLAGSAGARRMKRSAPELRRASLPIVGSSSRVSSVPSSGTKPCRVPTRREAARPRSAIVLDGLLVDLAGGISFTPLFSSTTSAVELFHVRPVSSLPVSGLGRDCSESSRSSPRASGRILVGLQHALDLLLRLAHQVECLFG